MARVGWGMSTSWSCYVDATSVPLISMNEPLVTLEETKHALGQLQANKKSDEEGSIVDLIQISPF